MHRGDDNHGKGVPVDGKPGLAEERGFEVAAKLVERLVHQGVGPDGQTEDVSEEPLNDSDEALSVIQFVPPV